MIVDDEPVAIRVMQQHLANMNGYEVVKWCTDALRALDYLLNNPVDLLFLDIEMPGLSGLQLFKSLENPPALILITAHRDYAVEGFELNAVDYLMKPVSFIRFVRALERFEHKMELNGPGNNSRNYVFVTVERIKKRVILEDIIYIESLKDYIRIITENEKIVTRETTTDFNERLPEESFLRIHRSFIVNKHKINTLGHDEITIGGYTLPVGRSYKNEVKEVLGIE